MQVGEWGKYRDKMPGHPKSVDTIVAISDDVICTGSSDGLIRSDVATSVFSQPYSAVALFPKKKLLGVVGEHEEFPIERIRLSGHTTTSHD